MCNVRFIVGADSRKRHDACMWSGLLIVSPPRSPRHAGDLERRVVVERKETLTLRFGVLVHDGDLDRRVAYQDLLCRPRDFD